MALFSVLYASLSPAVTSVFFFSKAQPATSCSYALKVRRVLHAAPFQRIMALVFRPSGQCVITNALFDSPHGTTTIKLQQHLYYSYYRGPR